MCCCNSPFSMKQQCFFRVEKSAFNWAANLTCSFPFAFFRKSSTASTACWKRLPLFILIISSLCGWYGFSCSTLIHALDRHGSTQFSYTYTQGKKHLSRSVVLWSRLLTGLQFQRISQNGIFCLLVFSDPLEDSQPG